MISKGRGETRDSLALWERAGVRVTNLEILSIASIFWFFEVLCG